MLLSYHLRGSCRLHLRVDSRSQASAIAGAIAQTSKFRGPSVGPWLGDRRGAGPRYGGAF
eukprot:215513-Alexandrium_andersonii.AAC.1